MDIDQIAQKLLETVHNYVVVANQNDKPKMGLYRLEFINELKKFADNIKADTIKELTDKDRLAYEKPF